MSQRAQPSETAMERMAQRVVGLIVTMGQNGQEGGTARV